MESVAFLESCTELKDVQNKIKYLREVEAKAKSTLVELCGGESRTVQGWTYSMFSREGSVNYKDIPQLRDVDLTPYRKEPVKVWKLSYTEQFKEIL